tara:strand:- start:743 stop:2188 length:1446 start_codon:yes stop_codon:yes gene_type:complete
MYKATLIFRILDALDRSLLRRVTITAVDIAAIVFRLPGELRDCLRRIPQYHPSHYSAAVLLWLIAARHGWRMPAYNIYKFIDSPEARQVAADICRERIERDADFRTQHQFFLLTDLAADDPEVVAFVKAELGRHYDAAAQAPLKSGVNFESSTAALALADTDRVFRAAGHRMFLVSGTFLGAIRDGRFVRSEYDIDVGFFANEVDIRDVARVMRDSMNFPNVTFNEYLVKATHANGTRVDIFAHFADDGLICHGSDKHRWYNTPFELTEIEFEAGRYQAPKDAERYLLENYGSWREPCAFWDVSFDTPNCAFPQTKQALFMLLRYATQSENRHRATMALYALERDFNIDYTSFIPHGESTELRTQLPNQRTVLVFVELDPPRRRELAMLAEAANLGTHVVAVLSTDELLRAENGSTPQLTLEERWEIAASLRHVDSVAACRSDGDRAAQARIHRARIALVDPHVRERFARLISGCEIVALL